MHQMIYDSLLAIQGVTVCYRAPSKPAEIPALSFFIFEKGIGVAADDGEYLSLCKVQTDVWHNDAARAVCIAEEAEDIMAGLGFTRTEYTEGQEEKGSNIFNVRMRFAKLC